MCAIFDCVLNWLTIPTILLIWLPRTIISSPKWKTYQSDDEVASAVEDYFEGQKETFLKTRIKTPLEKCVDLKGDFVEK